MEEMKNCQADELEKSHDKRWNSATNACGNQIKKLKEHIYKSGYEYGLTSAAILDDFELFDRIILCLPDVLAQFVPSSNEEEEDGEEGDGAVGGSGCHTRTSIQ